ncbi:MAG TPA: hypothetical protein VIM93_03965 [Kangiella sp.]
MNLILKFITALVIVISLLACDPKISREDYLFQVETYLIQFKERHINAGQYSLWIENYQSDSPMEKLLLFDSEDMKAVLFKPINNTFAGQFEKILAEEPSLIYAEALKRLELNRYFVDLKTCPQIGAFQKKLDAAKKAEDPKPPFYMLMGEATVSYYTGETKVEDDDQFSYKVTVTTAVKDQPMIQEMMLLLETVEACLE